MLNSISSVGRQPVSEKNTFFFLNNKMVHYSCAWNVDERRKTRLKLLRALCQLFQLQTQDLVPQSSCTCLFINTPKGCLSLRKCIQLTSERVMTRGLVPLHYSWDAFVSRRHANENSASRLIWEGAAGLCMAYFVLFFLPLVGVDVLRQGLYIDSTGGNQIDMESSEIQTRVWSRKS